MTDPIDQGMQEFTVTGRSGRVRQKTQLKVSRISLRWSPASASSGESAGAAEGARMAWRRLALSCLERVLSDSMARMAATRSLPAPGAGMGAGAASPEQSGQLQVATLERAGDMERHGECVRSRDKETAPNRIQTRSSSKATHKSDARRDYFINEDP
jgi:hypothetical protein